MNGRLRSLAIFVFALTLGFGAAMAQEDSVLQRYDLAVENLEFAVASVPGDGVQARDELERAINALLTLSRDSTSLNLVQAMQRTFERSHTAVGNQSRTDLAVQTGVLQGGFRRLVFDSAFTAAAAGDLPLAKSRLIHIGTELGFTLDQLTAINAAPDDRALRLAFETGTASSIAAQLTVAERLLESDRDAAYIALASAYGDSLLIQDSPRADPGLNASLVAAAQALVGNDPQTMGTHLQTAATQLGRLAGAALEGVEAFVPLPDSVVVPEPSGPQELPDLEGATTQPAPDSATQPEAAPTPETVIQPVTTPAATPTAEEIAAALSNEQLLAMAAATLLQQQREESLASLTSELVRAGLPVTLARVNAERLLDSGHTSLAGMISGLAASSANAIAAFRAGDVAAAHESVAAVTAAYAGPLSDLVTNRDATVAAETDELLASLAERPGLRQHDLTLLAGQVDAIDRTLTGRVQASSQGFELMVDGIWSNWVRLIAFVVLGILAFVPLRLLDIAFGGGNANWRLVSWALFLLLVPLFYEALAALGSILSRFLPDLPILEVLANWSIFTSTTAQAVWAVLLLFALVLASIGLRGICIQFGLLGRRGGTRVGLGTASQSPTLAENPRNTKPSAADWDEEF